MTSHRDTPREIIARATSGGPSWKWLAGVLLAVAMGIVGFAARAAFYPMESGVRLEQKHDAHCSESDLRHQLQAIQNKQVNQKLEEQGKEQRRTSYNVIRIGEALRVRGLETGE